MKFTFTWEVELENGEKHSDNVVVYSNSELKKEDIKQAIDIMDDQIKNKLK